MGGMVVVLGGLGREVVGGWAVGSEAGVGFWRGYESAPGFAASRWMDCAATVFLLVRR